MYFQIPRGLYINFLNKKTLSKESDLRIQSQHQKSVLLQSSIGDVISSQDSNCKRESFLIVL